MNPLFKLKFAPPTSKQDKETKNITKKINLNSSNAELSVKKVGGWKGYFITVDGQEKQVNKHKFYTHPINIKKLLSISKSGYATEEDKDLVNYYKSLASSKVEYKIPGVDSTINLNPKFEEPPKEDPHSKIVKMNIGSGAKENDIKQDTVDKTSETDSDTKVDTDNSPPSETENTSTSDLPNSDNEQNQTNTNNNE